MSESLSLILGGGGGDSGGVIGLFVFARLWLTKLSFPSVVNSSSIDNRLMSTSSVDGLLQLFVHSFECCVSSKAVFGEGGAPSCVGKSKWILRLEGTA